jgi:predicted aspartyl protease
MKIPSRRQAQIVAAFVTFLTGCGSHADAAVALNALGSFLTSRGYGGGQFVRHLNTFRLPIISNSKAGDLMIDTGAPTSVIFRQSLGKLSLTESQTEDSVGGAFGKGQERFGRAVVHSLTTGNCALQNVPVAVTNEIRAGGWYRRYGSSDGLFGLREMVGFGGVLDIGNRLLFLNPRGRSGDLGGPIRSLLTSQGYTPISLKLIGSHLYVAAVVNGAACNLIVDTGAGFTCFDRAFASKAKIGGKPSALVVEGLGKSGAREAQVATFPSLRIGDYEVKNASAAVVELHPEMVGKGTTAEAAGLLGADYLGLNSAVFDFNSLTLFLREKKPQP